MKRQWCVRLVGLLVVMSTGVMAADKPGPVDDIKSGAKTVGHGIATGAKESWGVVKEGAKEAGKAVSSGAKAVGHGVSDGYHSVKQKLSTTQKPAPVEQGKP